jgi:DNA (cytosine-5)-methyltransferase 1
MLRALDLFSGAGGATRGLQQAGYHVTGVDIKPQPRYCGDRFIQGDAMDVSLDGYDLIWGSPPCQKYTSLAALYPNKEYPDLIAPVRKRLIATGAPWIMENVPGAPLDYYITLCGTMFGLRVYRHRRFETSMMLWQPDHPLHTVRAGGHKSQRQRKAHYMAGGFVTITGNVGSYCGPAMGIDWMTGEELSQAIPPAYSKFLAEQVQQAVYQRSTA